MENEMNEALAIAQAHLRQSIKDAETRVGQASESLALAENELIDARKAMNDFLLRKYPERTK